MDKLILESEVRKIIETTLSKQSDIDRLLFRLDEFLTTQSEENKNLINSKVYTDRDTVTVRKYLLSKITSLTDKWTDFNESDAGVALVELMSGLADMLGFYLDKSALECYIGTVKQRKNAAKILNLIGYKLHGLYPSECKVRITTNSLIPRDVTIPRHTIFTKTSSNPTDKSTPIPYVLRDELTLRRGQWYVEGVAIQGEPQYSTITVGQLRNNIEVKILSRTVAINSFSIDIADKLHFNQVENSVNNTDDIRCYQVYENSECYPIIRFSSRWLEALEGFSDSDVITISYVTTLGSKGSITKGYLNSIKSKILDTDNSDITNLFSVSNIESSSGGSDRESLEEAKYNGPAKFSTRDTLVTLADFNKFFKADPRIQKAIALDWSIDGSAYVVEPYKVIAYALPKDSYTISDALRQDLLKEINKKKMTSIEVSILDPSYVTYNITANIYLSASYFNDSNFKTVLKANTEKYIKFLYNSYNLDFGTRVEPSTIITGVKSLSDKISSVSVDMSNKDLSLSLINFAKLGTLKINFYKYNYIVGGNLDA